MRRYRAFGLELESTFELPALMAGDEGRPVDVALELTDREAVEAAWSGPSDPPEAVDTPLSGGSTWRTESGAGGDLLFTYDPHALFWLGEGAGSLLCAPADPAAPAWKRELLDSALGSVALVRGFEGLHASSIEHDGGVAAFMAASGGGKTSLAAELVRRGAPLFGDDLLFLRHEGGRVLAYPAPPLMNVPLDRPDAVAPEELGREIARLGGEAWVEVARASSTPLPLRAVFVLERAEGLSPGVDRLDEPGPRLLLANALRSGSGAKRARARFEMLADMAAGVPQFMLRGDTVTPPAQLADLVEHALAGLEGGA